MTSKRQAFIEALLQGATIPQAAQVAGVSERTGYRYASEPDVIAALQDGQVQAIDRVCRSMTAGGKRALGVLDQVMSDATVPPGVRVRAALAWLDTMFRAREMLELEKRIEELEALACKNETSYGYEENYRSY